MIKRISARLLYTLLQIVDVVKWLSLVSALISLIVYLLIVSPYGQHKIAKLIGDGISSAGNGNCTIAKVRTSQFPMLEIYNLRWTSGSDTIIACDTIQFRVQVWSLLRKHLNIQYLLLRGVRLHLQQDSTHWNIAALFTKSAKPQTAIKPDSTKKKSDFPLKRIAVGNFSIQNSYVTVQSLNKSLQLDHAPITLRARTYLYLRDRMSLEYFHLNMPQVALSISSAKVNLAKSPPQGTFNGDLTIPDSTIRRFVNKWTITMPLAIDFNGSNTPNGLTTLVNAYLPGQSINLFLKNPDGKLENIDYDAKIENINIAPFISSIDSTNLTASAIGTIYNIVSDFAISGTLILKDSYFPPLKNITANVDATYGKHNATLKGILGESHGDVTIDLSTKGLGKDHSSATVQLSGAVHQLHDWLPGKDFPDSLVLAISATASGKKIPIDTIQFRAGLDRHYWFQNRLDTVVVSGKYTKKNIDIDSLHALSGKTAIALKGYYQLTDGFSFAGAVQQLSLKNIPQIVAADSTLSGQASLNFTIIGKQKKFEDSTNLSIGGTVHGMLTKFRMRDYSIDTLRLIKSEFQYPESPYLIEATIDSLRSTFLAPLSLSLSAVYRNDSLKTTIRAASDTLATLIKLQGFLDRNAMRFTAHADSLSLRTPHIPLYLLESEPLVYDRKTGFNWRQFRMDTPFGILDGSFDLDTAGSMKGSFSIKGMALPSLLTVVPSLQNLQGDVDATGTWSKPIHEKVHVSTQITTHRIGWNNLELMDTLKAKITYTGDRLIWEMKGEREGIEALTSYGNARMTDSSIAGFDSLHLSTIEMPSRWFAGMMPQHSTWDGNLQIQIDRDPVYGMKMKVDMTGKKLLLPEFGVDQRDMVIHASTVGKSLVIQEATSKSGKGNIKLTGQLTFRNFLPDSLNLEARASRYQFMKLPRKTFTGDMNVNLRGPINHLAMEGSMALSEVRYDLGETDKNLEEIVLEEDDISIFPALATWDNSYGHVSVIAPGNVWIRGMGINAEAKMDLDLEKFAGNRFPNIYGKIEIARGTVTQYSRQLQISQGIMTFNGDPFNPQMQLTASAPSLKRSAGVDIQFSITGTAKEPNIIFAGTDRNGEKMNDLDVISYLTIGKPSAALGMAGSGADTSKLGAKDLVGTATQMGFDQITNSLGNKFGLSVLQFRQDQRKDLGSTAGELEIGGYITNELFFSLVSPVGGIDSSNNKVRVEYQLLPWLRLAASRDQEGRQSLESFIQTDWGEPPRNTPRKKESEK